MYRVDQESDSGVNASELDEMWSYVGKKANQRWLWQAINHWTGEVLAHVFGRRKDEVLLELKRSLEPFGIKKYYTDGRGHTNVIYQKKNMKLGNEILKQLSRNTFG